MTYNMYAFTFAVMMCVLTMPTIYFIKFRKEIGLWFSRWYRRIKSWRIWYWRFFVDIRNYTYVCQEWSKDLKRLRELEYLCTAQQAKNGNLQGLFDLQEEQYHYETHYFNGKPARYRWHKEDWIAKRDEKSLVFTDVRRMKPGEKKRPKGYYIKRKDTVYEVLSYEWKDKAEKEDWTPLHYEEFPITKVSYRSSDNGQGRSERHAQSRVYPKRSR